MKFFFYLRRNDWIDKLETSLVKLGHEVKGIDKNFRLSHFPKVVSEDPNLIHFVWSGPFRKIFKDKFTAPNISYMEQGYLPHYESIMFDAKGHGANSSNVNLLPELLDDSKKIELENYLDRTYFIKYDHSKISSIVSKIKKPFVLFPIQHTSDSVIRFDSSVYARNYTQVINDILQNVPPGYQVIVKQHPKSNSGFKYLPNPRITYIDKVDDSLNSTLNDWLLNNCEALISINSSYIFESLARNVPTLAIGKGNFTGNKVVLEEETVKKGFLDRVFVEKERNLALLYHLCLDKQIAKIDVNNIDVVKRIFDNYKTIYEQK